MRTVLRALLVLLLAGFAALVYRMRFEDAALVVDAPAIARLAALRQEPKFLDLPGVPRPRLTAERQRNTDSLNELLDRVQQGIQANPSQRWLFNEMAPTVSGMALEDTEARERYIDYLVRLDRIFGIESTHGAFATDLIFF
jgi:hypothetical protein